MVYSNLVSQTWNNKAGRSGSFSVEATLHYSSCQDKAIRLVDHERTIIYWQIGQRIFEEEQQDTDQAEYGNYLTQFIAKQLEPEYV